MLFFAAWLVLTFLIFFGGVAVAMFPKRLPSGMLKDAVHSILALASGTEREEENEEEERPADDGKIDDFIIFLNKLIR